MVAISLLTALVAATASTVSVSARPLPYEVRLLAKRQGTLVQSAAISFGKCTTPQIIGAVGLDGRTEFAFQPADKTSYPHTSAQGIQIITQFICDTLVNTCGATTGAHNLCTATQAAVGAGKNDGGLADKFNAAFGLKTNFVAAKGSIPAGAVAAAPAAPAAPAKTTPAAQAPAAAATATAAVAPCAVAPAAAAPAANAGASKAQGTLVQSTAVNFGKCTTPQIIGAVGLDGRTEFAFQPADKTSYPHGSAQGIQIITQFICDTLVNTCGATTAAHDLCTATQAAVGAGKNDGGLADKFNAAFGLKTNFVAATGSIPAGGFAVAAPAAPATTQAAAPAASAAAPCVVAPAAAAPAPAPAAPAPAASAGAINLGTCSNPQIDFKNGLDGRQQPAFIADNQVNFNHGSALNIAVITGFIAQRFQSPCGANAAAVAAATAGAAAAQAAGGNTGAAADAWNKAFGITTNFAAGATN